MGGKDHRFLDCGSYLKRKHFFQYLFFIVIAYLEANNFFVVVILAISVNIIVFFIVYNYFLSLWLVRVCECEFEI